LDTPLELNVGSRLQDRGDALTTCCADRNQAADGLPGFLLLLGQLLGQLRHDPPAGRGERVARGERRAVDVELGFIDAAQCTIQAEPLLAVLYGAPLWDQARVSADNPVERIDSYRNKRIFLVAGTSPDPLNWFDSVNETQVLAGQREFRERLSEAGIPHEAHEEPGGHVFRPDMFRLDLDGIIARLRPAAVVSPSSAPPQL
jgi:hypothetical protein